MLPELISPLGRMREVVLVVVVVVVAAAAAAAKPPNLEPAVVVAPVAEGTPTVNSRIISFLRLGDTRGSTPGASCFWAGMEKPTTEEVGRVLRVVEEDEGPAPGDEEEEGRRRDAHDFLGMAGTGAGSAATGRGVLVEGVGVGRGASSLEGVRAGGSSDLVSGSAVAGTSGASASGTTDNSKASAASSSGVSVPITASLPSLMWVLATDKEVWEDAGEPGSVGVSVISVTLDDGTDELV